MIETEVSFDPELKIKKKEEKRTHWTFWGANIAKLIDFLGKYSAFDYHHC